MRVLIVDDSLVARDLLQEFVELCGHQVAAQADTLQSALYAYRAHKPDLVTLDLCLADTDGLDILKALRALDPKARVIIISGNIEQRVHEEVVEAGAAGFLSKPFTMDDIRRILNKFSTP